MLGLADQFGLHQLPLGDVPEDPQHGDDPASRIAQWHGGDGHVDQAAIAVVPLSLVVQYMGAGQCARPDLVVLHLGDAVKGGEAMSDHLLSAPSEDAFGGGVPKHRDPGRVNDGQSDRGLSHHSTQEFVLREIGAKAR